MDTTHLGRTGLKVSRQALGTMNFGELTDETTSFAFMDEALAWVLHNPVITAPLSGPRTVEQLRQNLKAPYVKLSAETLAKLGEIWPGPGGEAPVTYAW